jgi:putative GTP pyrophosphokinase
MDCMMSNFKVPDKNVLQNIYERYLPARTLITRDLEARIEEAVSHLPSRLRVTARVKDFTSYHKKYIRLLQKEAAKPADSASTDPLITDIIGVRIVCLFFEDLSTVVETMKGLFEVVEVERKGSNYSFKEFGYESIHLLIKVPASMIDKHGNPGLDLSEIQIRTVLQDAWAEVEHDLIYKAEFSPFDESMKRKLAAVNASLSLADTIFQEIRTYQRQLNGELGKRRDSFFKKIEEFTDDLLFTKEDRAASNTAKPIPPNCLPGQAPCSIDDLLLNALYAHNRNEFDEAILFYTRILDMQPHKTIGSLIYKHRGMAYFAQSRYEDAITDFTSALDLDAGSHKAAYYRGVVNSVLQRFPNAIDDFTLSLQINPYQAFCFYRRGQAYYHIEDFPQALSDCESSLALEPESKAVQRLKAQLLDKLQE